MKYNEDLDKNTSIIENPSTWSTCCFTRDRSNHAFPWRVIPRPTWIDILLERSHFTVIAHLRETNNFQ